MQLNERDKLVTRLNFSTLDEKTNYWTSHQDCCIYKHSIRQEELEFNWFHFTIQNIWMCRIYDFDQAKRGEGFIRDILYFKDKQELTKIYKEWSARTQYIAEEFKIPGLSTSITEFGQLNAEIAKTVTALLNVSKEGVKVSTSFKSVGDVKGLQNFEKTAKASITGVNSAYKRLNEQQQAQLKILKDQQRASLSLAAAERDEAVQVEKLKLKRQELTKESKRQAKEELGLVSAYDKVVAKMNKAGKAVQNLNAKRLSGQKLTDKEQRELKQSTIEFTKYQDADIKTDPSIGRFQRKDSNYPKDIDTAHAA